MIARWPVAVALDAISWQLAVAAERDDELVAYVPPDRRREAIAAVPKSLQPVFSKVAADAPDLSAPTKLMRLSDFLAGEEGRMT